MTRHIPAQRAASARESGAPADEEALEETCARLQNHLQSLSPFIPSPVLTRLHTPDLLDGGLYLQGTLISADLSGFTALSAQLAARGRQGNEELSTLINQLFAELIAEIYRYGGGVLQFSGDAFTAFFDHQELGEQHLRLGAAAALALQERTSALADVRTSLGPLPLRLRVALQQGRLFVCAVGPSQRRELFMTGRGLNQVVRAQDQAAPGEIIVTQDVLPLLPGATAAPKNGPYYLLQASPPVTLPTHVAPPAPPSADLVAHLRRQIEVAEPFASQRMLVRALAGELGGGEFRPVTVAFTNFYPLHKLLWLLERVEADPETLGLIARLAQAYYLDAHGCIEQLGGMINKIDMAPAGNRLMALFGAPRAYEDDPIRAVQAMLALGEQLQETEHALDRLLQAGSPSAAQAPWSRSLEAEPRARAGIASGSVFAGLIGSAERREYTVMGQTVNLAARLLSVAGQGDLLLAARTHKSTQHMVKAQQLAPVWLKGFERPVPVFRVLRRDPSKQARLRHSAPLIGRQQERRLLTQTVLGALRRGRGRAISLLGEPGIGKSRLAEEVATRVARRLRGIRIVREACRSYERMMPYTLVSRIVRQLLSLPAELPPEQQLETLAERIEALPPRWQRFSALLAPLLGLPLPELPLLQALSAEQRRARLHELLVQLVRACTSKQATLLIVDDLLWIDASSQEVMQLLLPELAQQPLVLLLISRGASPLVDLLPPRDPASRIVVEELSAAESAQLIEALLQSPPPDELAPLLQRASGVPLFIEETIRYVLESGILTKQPGGGWSCRPLAEGAIVPMQLEQLLIARLDRFSYTTRTLLQIAAVIGYRVALPVLADVVPLDLQATLARQLRELCDVALLEPLDEEPDTYAFRHVLVRDVIYESLLFAQRRELHALVATSLERRYHLQLGDYHGLIGHHYAAAERWHQAFQHLIAAAHGMYQRYSCQEAIALYQQALAIVEAHEELAVEERAATLLSYEQLGELLALTGDYAGARRYFELLLDLPVPHHHTIVEQAALKRKLGATYQHQGSLEEALVWLDRAAGDLVGSLQSPPARVEYARILSEIGWVFFRQHDYQRAEQELTQALQHIAGQDRYEEELQIHHRLGGIAWTRGKMNLAQYYVEQSLAASVRSGALVQQAHALNNLGLITEAQGKLSESIHYGLQAIELNERIGNRRDLAISSNNLGFTLYDAGEYERAQTYLEQALALTREVHDTYHQMLAELNLGRVQLAAGALDQAEAASFRCLALAAELQVPLTQLDAHVVLAEVALARGEHVQAEHAYHQAREFLEQDDSEEGARLLRLEAQLLVLRGEEAAAMERLIASEDLFIQLQNQPEADRSRRLRDRIAPPG